MIARLLFAYVCVCTYCVFLVSIHIRFSLPFIVGPAEVAVTILKEGGEIVIFFGAKNFRNNCDVGGGCAG